jgi:hypothetical protein
MAISSELSSEIAIALLADAKKPPRERETLKETLVKVHLILQEMNKEARAARDSRIARESHHREI